MAFGAFRTIFTSLLLSLVLSSGVYAEKRSLAFCSQELQKLVQTSSIQEYKKQRNEDPYSAANINFNDEIKLVLRRNDAETKDFVTALARLALHDGYPDISRIAFSYLKDNDLKNNESLLEFLNLALPERRFAGLRSEVFAELAYRGESRLKPIVQEALKSTQPLIDQQSIAIDFIRRTDSKELHQLVARYLDSSIDSLKALSALTLIHSSPELTKNIKNIALQKMKSTEPNTSGLWFRVVEELFKNKETSRKIIEQRIKKLSAMKLSITQASEINRALNYLIWRYVAKSLHPLYSALNKKNALQFFSIKSQPIPILEYQPKTLGSLILLGGKLAGDIAYRVLPKVGEVQWLKALKAEEKWKLNGFVRPPIEPIVSIEKIAEKFHLSSQEVSDLKNRLKKYKGGHFVQLLGPSFDSIENLITKLEEYHLRARMNRILVVLKNEIKTVHGDSHSQNWILSDDPNNLDEIFLIDFDHAVELD